MLCFFKRVTMGLWQEKLVYWLMWACGISYCAVVLTVRLAGLRIGTTIADKQ